MERAFQVGRSTRRYGARRRCRASDRKATRATRSSAATASAVCSTSTSRSAPRRTALSCLPWTVSTSLRSPDQRTRRRSRWSSPLPSSASQWNPLPGTRSRPTLAKFGAIWYPRAHVNKHDGTRRQDCRGLEGRRGVGGALRVYLSSSARQSGWRRSTVSGSALTSDFRTCSDSDDGTWSCSHQRSRTTSSTSSAPWRPRSEGSTLEHVKPRGASYTACAARLDWAQPLCEAIAEQGHDIALRLVRDRPSGH